MCRPKGAKNAEPPEFRSWKGRAHRGAAVRVPAASARRGHHHPRGPSEGGRPAVPQWDGRPGSPELGHLPRSGARKPKPSWGGGRGCRQSSRRRRWCRCCVRQGSGWDSASPGVGSRPPRCLLSDHSRVFLLRSWLQILPWCLLVPTPIQTPHSGKGHMSIRVKFGRWGSRKAVRLSSRREDPSLSAVDRWTRVRCEGRTHGIPKFAEGENDSGALTLPRRVVWLF